MNEDLKLAREAVQKQIEEVNKELHEILFATQSKASSADIIAPDQKSWEINKAAFKKDVELLMSRLETGEIADTSVIIGNVIKTLQFWKGRINKYLMDENQSV